MHYNCSQLQFTEIAFLMPSFPFTYRDQCLIIWQDTYRIKDWSWAPWSRLEEWTRSHFRELLTELHNPSHELQLITFSLQQHKDQFTNEVENEKNTCAQSISTHELAQCRVWGFTEFFWKKDVAEHNFCLHKPSVCSLDMVAGALNK